jgi:hypothetical protein
LHELGTLGCRSFASPFSGILDFPTVLNFLAVLNFDSRALGLRATPVKREIPSLRLKNGYALDDAKV